VVAWQVSVAVPEIVILVGLRLQLRLVELVVTVRATVPLKPPSGVTVMVLVPPGGPVLIVIELGLAVSVNSCTLNVTIVL
jgi:hypothetical protein